MPDSNDSARAELLALARVRMPFGKYTGRLLIQLPEAYLVWMARQGFPAGRLGEQLQLAYEIRRNGLEYLFAPLGGSVGGHDER